jgi:SRSO17 transposase
MLILPSGRQGWTSCWAGSHAGFPGVEPRRRARAFVLGLLSELPRKNCWTIAEHAGDASPDGMQHLLARAVWDEDGVRDDVRADVVEHHQAAGIPAQVGFATKPALATRMLSRALDAGVPAAWVTGDAGQPCSRRGPALDDRDVSTTVHSYMWTGCMISAAVGGR